MRIVKRAGQFAMAAVAAIGLAACAGQKEPAGRLINDIESEVTAASGEAAKYVPDQLTDVRGRFAALKTAYDKQDYGAVVTGAPAVLSAAKSLATSAATKKDEVLKALNGEWNSLAGSLPANMSAIQSRIDRLGKKSSKKLAAGIDLAAAKSSAGDVTSIWSKAQAAFASGNLDEAVTAAKDARGKVDALAATLKMDLGAAAAAATP